MAIISNFPCGGGLKGVVMDEWSTGVAAPTSSNRSTSQLYNGKIYCIAATGGSAVVIYDIASDTWTTGAAFNTSHTTSQLYNGKIYCPASSGTAISIYDIASDTRTVGTTAPASVTRSTSQLYNGKIYCPQSGGTAMQIYAALAFE